MAKNRTPQSFEKRRRERDKQLKRAAKQAARIARNAAKREAKEEGGNQPSEGLVIERPTEPEVQSHDEAGPDIP